MMLTLVLIAGTAGEIDTARAVNGLQDWLDGTRSLSGKFEQVVISGMLGPGEPESGHIKLRRPGFMRWDYTDPENKTTLLLGTDILLYLEEDRQLIRSTLSEENDLLPSLLVGRGRIEELFEATLLPRDRGRHHRLRLVPRDRHGSFEEVILILDRKSYAIKAIEVRDAAGNHMEYRFKGFRRNQRLPEGTFQFEPPPGTEIVDGY